MLVYHEGLPGAGKSYEAAVYHILPALEKRRKVYARINGLNHEKFAELSGLTVEECQDLLLHVEEEQVKTIHEAVTDRDCLVIIDEPQNFFPPSRQPLSAPLTKWVSEHRHMGLDIILMGQNLKDVHTLWRNRTDRKLIFTKMDAVGLDSRYKWEAYKAQVESDSKIKWIKINGGNRKYDSKYFGLYASHKPDTGNTDTYADDRSNLLKTPALKYGMPAAALVAVWAVWHLLGFFSEEGAAELTNGKAAAPARVAPAPAPAQPAPSPAPRSQQQASPQVDEKKPPLDAFDAAVEQLQIRISGLLQWDSGPKKGQYIAQIDAMDASYHIKEQFTTAELESMGWTLKRYLHGIEASKGGKTHLLRMKPLDLFGHVPDRVQKGLAAQPSGAASAAGDAVSGGSSGPATWSNPGAGIGPMPVEKASAFYDQGALVQRSRSPY